ncbi:hypothetical protein M407DRAFT_178524 [Tulasnella calospora MUT 4182]|uniref:Uncharacterized protein n=1 Tax=Tulasnella calospora MUT 4182 TaxID=1051891 RepID=A0A0C3L4B5_9AGAM|nr:hypothetical protein M407DRAFT_178524 [Tulasnella calospora MUT 4182]
MLRSSSVCKYKSNPGQQKFRPPLPFVSRLSFTRMILSSNTPFTSNPQHPPRK